MNPHPWYRMNVWSTSSVLDECVVLSVLPTAEESQNLMTCPRVAQNEDFCPSHPVAYLPGIGYRFGCSYVFNFKFMVFSSGFFSTLKTTFGGIGGTSICYPLNVPFSFFPSQT